MSRLRSLLIVMVLTSGFLSVRPAPGHTAPSIGLSSFASGMSRVVAITHSPDTTGRMFFTEQDGRIKVRTAAGVVSTYLDIASIVRSPADPGGGGEEGLLSLAFHPSFSTNGLFFVFYTNVDSNLIVARYAASPSTSNTVSTSTGQTILAIPHPTETNHNGGQLQFGPDGNLYISTGDGGGAGDPSNNAQNKTKLLGKILRVSPTTGTTASYTIPSGNPFTDNAGTNADEIWAYGLRNPFRFSFDRTTGDMFIGDVGQGAREEVDFQPAGSGGLNYGWRTMEGTTCFNASACDTAGLTMPILEYPNAHPSAVTGGYRYRGPVVGLRGFYFYADFYSGVIWSAESDNGQWFESVALDTALNISSFGEDKDGNLYVGDYNGTVYRMNAECPAPSASWDAYASSFSGGVYVAAGDLDGDGCDEVVTGAGEGGGAHLRAFKGDGSPIASAFPYPSGFYGGVRAAVGDVTGDAREEIITAAGPGGGSHIRVWKLLGAEFVEVSGFFAYPDGFYGGSWVAAADVTGDGKSEIITGAGESGGSHVRIFDWQGNPISGFFAYPDGFYGGVRVAGANLDGAGKSEIITGAGPSGGPHVRTFTGTGNPYQVSFFAYSGDFHGGVFVGGGEVRRGSSNPEIVTGAGQGGGSHVRIFSSTGSALGGFFSYPDGFYGGVRVATGDTDSDGNGEVITAPGPGYGPNIKLFE